MTDKKITDLTAITGANTASGDEFAIVDVSVDETKKITRAELAVGLGAIRLYRFDFAFDTPNLNTGITVYTPAVGDVLYDAIWSVSEAFDGTTPRADFGAWWQAWGVAKPDLSIIDTDLGNGLTGSNIPNGSMSAIQMTYAIATAPNTGFPYSIAFNTTDPLEMWVSQSGTQGGSAIGGTAGQGSLYLFVASPVVFNA